MKYVLILLDGMADYPIQKLNGKTPLEFAFTPAMDAIAKSSEIGLVRTVPDGFKPGSDVANLGVLGYDVRSCYTGRSPLEALSIGINMQDDDLALRANLVTLSNEADYEQKTMLDYSAGEISTDEARILLDDLSAHLKSQSFAQSFELHCGISYRHCLILKHSSPNEILTPPHDILDRRIADYLPTGGQSALLLSLMKASYEFLSKHSINLEREANGKKPANSLWFWGEGTKPNIQSFEKKYGKRCAMISAVDLLKGIAIGSGMKGLEVDGATGTLNTNFDGKAQSAIEVLDSGIADVCMIHLEATDECGHQGDVDGKVKAIELIDEKIISKVLGHFESKSEPISLLIMPDHYTPISKRTHTGEPVPYMLYTSSRALGSNEAYSEQTAKDSKILFENPWELTERFLSL